MPAAYFRADAQGLILSLRVTPKASRDAVLGVMELPSGQALKVAVSAPPDKGAANDAVCVLLAEAFAVAKSAVTVVLGVTDRHKKVRVGGDPVALSRIAETLPEAAS